MSFISAFDNNFFLKRHAKSKHQKASPAGNASENQYITWSRSNETSSAAQKTSTFLSRFPFYWKKRGEREREMI